MERALGLLAAVFALLGAPLLPGGAGLRAQDAARGEPRPRPSAPAEFELVWGAGGVPVAGRLNPLLVRFESLGPAVSSTVAITMSTRSPFGDRLAVCELRWPVRLPARGEASLWLVVPGEPGPKTVQVDAQAFSPSALPQAASQRSSPGPVALVLSTSPEGWEFLGQWRTRQGDGRAGKAQPLRVVYLTGPPSVPPWFLGYQGAELVGIAPDFPLDRLSPAQARALVAYARDGGRLVVPQTPPLAWLEAPVAALFSGPAAAMSRRVALDMGQRGAPDPGQFARAASALALERAAGEQEQTLASPSIGSEDPLREQVLAALSGTPVSLPPRWAALAAGAYALAGWAWVRAFPKWRPRNWAAGGLLLGAVSLGSAFFAGTVFFEQADQPQAVLLVRPATLTDPQADRPPVRPGDPVQAELLLNLPGLLSTPWEIRPAPGRPDLLPSPLGPSELAPGTRGIRLEGLPGPDGRVAWRIEPLAASPDAGPPGPAGGWPAAFFVDAPLVDLAGELPETARAAIVSASGAAAASRADVTFQGRVAVLAENAARAMGVLERRALEPGPEALERKLVEALGTPRAAADAPLVAVAASAGSRLAGAAPSVPAAAAPGYPGEEPAADALRPRYAVVVGRTASPLAEARRPGRPWRPVRPYVILITAVVAGAAPPGGGGSGS